MLRHSPRLARRLCRRLGAGLLFGNYAFAQTPPPPAVPPQATAAEEKGIETIVVTANRREERQREVANSVTALSGAELARKNEVRLQDLVGQVPGLSLEEDSPTQTRIVIRGLNAGGAGATVATVVDDVPTNTAGSQNDGSTITPNFDTYDLQRVEVLRGAQSSLYGATAEGGLIKYVTAPPDPTRYAGSVEAGFDGLTAGGIGGTLKGFANLPIVPDKVALRVTAATEWFPGYIDDPERQKTDINSGQQYDWRASLLLRPVDDLSVRLLASRQSVFFNDNNDVQVRGAALTPPSPPANQLDLLDPLQKNARFPSDSQDESAVYYADIRYDLGFANLTSLTSYVFNNLKFNSDDTNVNLAPGVPFGLGVAGLYGGPVLIRGRQNNDTGKFNQEVRLASEPGFRIAGYALDWQGGFFFTHETETQDLQYDVRSVAPPYSILAPAGGGEIIQGSYSEWAVFGQTTLHITPAISIDLGGRYGGNDQHSQLSVQCCVVLGPAGVLPQNRSNDHDALYTVAPKWRIDDDTLGYIRLATGYRPGGPNLPIPGISGVPEKYNSDRTVNYEIGVRRDLFDKAVEADITGFYINWKQIQVTSFFQTASGPVNVIGNAGVAVSKGVEWSLTWKPLRGLRLSAVGSYTDARLTEAAPGLGANNGDFLPFVPQVSNSVNVDYNWDLTDNTQAFVSGTWTHIGDRFTGFTPSTTVSNSHTLLPGYDTGAIRVGIERGRYSAEAYIDNISDERGITTYLNNGGINQTGLATLIQPRLIGATVRVKF